MDKIEYCYRIQEIIYEISPSLLFLQADKSGPFISPNKNIIAINCVKKILWCKHRMRAKPLLCRDV